MLNKKVYDLFIQFINIDHNYFSWSWTLLCDNKCTNHSEKRFLKACIRFYTHIYFYLLNFKAVK